MAKPKERLEKKVWIYLSDADKQALTLKASATNQKLSAYIRNCLTRRINKIDVSKEAIADRILLSKVKQSIMMLRAIAKSSDDATNRDKILNELDSLTNVIDPAIMASMGLSGDDSSNLSEG